MYAQNNCLTTVKFVILSKIHPKEAAEAQPVAADRLENTCIPKKRNL